jgi:hypothetical protein
VGISAVREGVWGEREGDKYRFVPQVNVGALGDELVDEVDVALRSRNVEGSRTILKGGELGVAPAGSDGLC